MSEPFLGEIRAFSFDFPPRGWALCDGSLMSISANQALFALLGNTYGGDGRTTFRLPDLRGRAPVHVGSQINWGEMAGEEEHTLTVSEMPPHTHMVEASSEPPSSRDVSNRVWAPSTGDPIYADSADGLMAFEAFSNAGGGLAHPNMQPYTVINYCIAISGIFPSRN